MCLFIPQLAAVGLRECFVRLNPVRFSPHMLAAVEAMSPSDLSSSGSHDVKVG